MTFLSFPPPQKKKKKKTFLTSHRWRFPPYRGHMKKLPSLLTQQVQGCAVPKKKQMWMWKAAIYIAVLWGYWMHMCYWDIWWTLNVLNGFSKLRGPFFSSILLSMMIMGGVIISLSKNKKKTLLLWTIFHNLHIFSFKISPFAAALPNLCQVAPVRISSSPGAKTRRRSSTLRWRSQNSCGGVSWWIMMNHGYQ